MAVELLRRQVGYLKAENAARKKGKQGPPTLSTQRRPYHDLEALLWVLVYAMMIRNYNSLTHENDRKAYKKEIDNYFGHGSTKTIAEKRQIMYLAHSRVGDNCVPSWFPDLHERRFFVRCMTLIAKHDKEEEEEDCGQFEGEISDDNPLWDSADDESHNSPDKDIPDKSGKYLQRKVIKAAQEPVLRKRSPVITYESVVAILKKSIDELN